MSDPLLVKHGNRMLATARAEVLHAAVRDGLALVRTSLRRAERASVDIGVANRAVDENEMRAPVADQFGIALAPFSGKSYG
jgi:DNA-binding transcriptional LysR family regulator